MFGNRKWTLVVMCPLLQLVAVKIGSSNGYAAQRTHRLCNLTKSAYSIATDSNATGKVIDDAPCLEKLSQLENDGKDPEHSRNENNNNSSNRIGANMPDSNCSNDQRSCIPICCPLASRIENNTCTKTNGSVFLFPAVYDSTTLELTEKKVNGGAFSLFVSDPCNGAQKYKLYPEEFKEDSFMLLDNGSVFQDAIGNTLGRTEYCLGIVEGNTYDVIMCFEDIEGEEEDMPVKNALSISAVGLIVSVPFLFATFLAYSLIPDLKNMHGRTLRGYVGSLLVAYVFLAIVQLTPQDQISDSFCIFLAFTIHFSFLASFFWLNVMCFDIWWTFGGFRSLQGSVKQRERKKFVIYSAYAWGCASILTGVCIIMDFVPSVPDHFIKPQFGVQSCWFTTDAAKAIYFYGPMGVTVFCNICLFVSTALKIVRHKKDTAHHLKGSDSRRHDDNKQWFNLYLKLFIVMGINWSMEIVSWLCHNSPAYVWYLTDLTNTLQGVIIFLIFVWKDKIKRLLLKRFGCHGRDILSRNSTRSAYHSSASRTCTTSAAPLQEKVNPYTTEATSYRTRVHMDDSDCT